MSGTGGGVSLSADGIKSAHTLALLVTAATTFIHAPFVHLVLTTGSIHRSTATGVHSFACISQRAWIVGAVERER